MTKCNDTNHPSHNAKNHIKLAYDNLIANMPNCKIRQNQFKMIEVLNQCFNNGNYQEDTDTKSTKIDESKYIQSNNPYISMIEAPTGTGKSLAYLLAGVLNAREHNKTLLISTATKTLQNQLIELDIPQFIQYSGININYQIAKGRANYLCPYQLELLIQSINQGNAELYNLFTNELTNITEFETKANALNIMKYETVLLELMNMFINNWTGELDNIRDFNIPAIIKPLVTTNNERCIGKLCPYYINPHIDDSMIETFEDIKPENLEQHDTAINETKKSLVCPYYNNRKKLKTAEVIVINHSLLLAKTNNDAVLPNKFNDYILCIDEAHSFADYAIDSLSSEFALKKTIINLERLEKLIYNPNSLYLINNIILCDSLINSIKELQTSFKELLLHLKNNITLFVDMRLIINDYLNEHSSFVKDHFINVLIIASDIYNNLSKLIEELKIKIKDKNNYKLEDSIAQILVYYNIVETILTTAEYIINQDDSRYNANAKWITCKLLNNENKNHNIDSTAYNLNNHDYDFIVSASKTYVGDILAKKIWHNVYALALTSGTLSTHDNFNYFLHKLGLLNLHKKNNVVTAKLETEFNYTSQAQLLVPKFTYTPDYNNKQDFTNELVRYLHFALNYSSAYGTLVLFFNKQQLQECYHAIDNKLKTMILSQLDFNSNHNLINEHKKRIDNKQSSIIFGLNSFIEGVNLPREYLMHVIITKLPFESFKDPLNMVQEYWFKYEKANYFMEVTVPEVCIKLIQAVGRLIRSDTDYGQITICDNRILTKKYGNLLLRALPKFNYVYNIDFIKNQYLRYYQ